MAAKDERR